MKKAKYERSRRRHLDRKNGDKNQECKDYSMVFLMIGLAIGKVLAEVLITILDII